MFSTPQKTHFWPLPTADTFSTVAASLLIFTASDVFTCLLKVSFLPPRKCFSPSFIFIFNYFSRASCPSQKRLTFFTNHSYQSGYFFLPVGRLSINGITGQFFGSQLDFLCCWVLSSTFSFFFLPSKFMLWFICLPSFGNISYLMVLESWSPDNQGFTVARSINHSHGAHSQL